MKYYLVEPVADAEIGEKSLISSPQNQRKLIHIHAYLFSMPESDLIQAYPVFLVSDRLKNLLQRQEISGALYLNCELEKSPQFDEFSKGRSIPLMHCLEPCGSGNIDDIVFFSETEIKVSDKFISALKSVAHTGCIIRNAT